MKALWQLGVALIACVSFSATASLELNKPMQLAAADSAGDFYIDIEASPAANKPAATKPAPKPAPRAVTPPKPLASTKPTVKSDGNVYLDDKTDRALDRILRPLYFIQPPPRNLVLAWYQYSQTKRPLDDVLKMSLRRMPPIPVIPKITKVASAEKASPTKPKTTPDISNATQLALPTTEGSIVPPGFKKPNLAPDDKKGIMPLQMPNVPYNVTPAPVATPTTVADTAPPADAAKKLAESDKPAAGDDKKQVADAKKKTLVPVGRVVWVKGVFKAKHAGKDTRELTKQSIIFVGDTLETDGKTQAQIAFTDTTLMTFRPNTKFVINDYQYHPKKKEGKSVGKYVMDLVAGGFRTITGLIPKANPDDYQVKTPVATIGVRGTDFTVFVGGGGNNAEVVLGQLKGIPTIQTGNKPPVSLDENMRYATVKADGSIIITTERPPILDTPLPIVPATIKPITADEVSGVFTSGGQGEWCIL